MGRSKKTSFLIPYTDSFLISKDVRAIVIACGTATSQAIDVVKDLYSIPDTFSNDLSCMCVVGMLGVRVFDAHISPEDFGRHVPIFNIGKFVNPVKFDDDLARHPVKEKKM